MKVTKSLSNKVKLLIIALSSCSFNYIGTYAQDNPSLNNVLYQSTVIIEAKNGTGYGIFLSDSIIAANLNLIYGSIEVSYKFYKYDTTYKISAYWTFDKGSNLILLAVTDQNRNALNIYDERILPGQKLKLLGSIDENHFYKTYDGIVSNLKYNDDIEIFELNTSTPISSITGGPVWNNKNKLVGIYSGQVLKNNNGSYVTSSGTILSLINYLDTEKKSLSILSEEIEEFYPQISVGDIKYFSLNKNNLSTRKWPVIVERSGNILTIESKHSKPSISNRCIIYESRHGESVLVASGNVIHATDKFFTIDLIENIITTVNHSNTFIFFQKEY